jgi:hypothetical protein
MLNDYGEPYCIHCGYREYRRREVFVGGHVPHFEYVGRKKKGNLRLAGVR